jgi:beta-lactam-binding protein with PASTA domain
MAGLMIQNQKTKSMMAARPSLIFKVVKERSKIAPPGMIFLETPYPGTQVPSGTVVTVYVSTGP